MMPSYPQVIPYPVYQRSSGYRRRSSSSYYKKKYKKQRRQWSARARAARTAFSSTWPRGTAESKLMFGPHFSEANKGQRAMRKLFKFRGPGDYRDWLKWGSRGLGAAVGGALGFMNNPGIMGAAEGLKSGFDKGADFSRYMGWGDYGPISANEIMDVGAGSQQQISVNRDDLTGDIYFSHTEFIQNIYASGTGGSTSTFNIVNFPINPGLAVTFPFLSQLAQNFTMYEPLGLIFQYKPTSGEYGNNNSNSIGKVIFATNYDPDAPDFLNSIQMENYDYANSTKPSCGMVHGVECAPPQRNGRSLYVRTGTSPKDKIFTDLGQFFVATEGIPFGGAGPQTALLGELWVTYRFKLTRANLYGSLLGQNIGFDAFKLSGTNTTPLSLQVIKSTNNIGVTLTSSSATTIAVTFPENISLGAYIIYCDYLIPAGGVDTFINLTAGANCTTFIPMEILPIAINNAAVHNGPATGVAANVRISTMCGIQVLAPGNLQATITLQLNAALPVGTSTGYLYVMQINNSAIQTSLT